MINNSDILVREGLDKNLLYFRPLTTRLMNVTGHASVSVKNLLANRHWNGHVVTCLSGATYVTGALAAIPCAIVENVASTTLCLVGAAANRVTMGQFPSIKHFSIKCYCYSAESLTQILIPITLLALRTLPTYHTAVTLFDQVPHLAFALIAHALRLASYADRQPEDERAQYLNARGQSVATLVIEWIQNALDETLRSFAWDLGSETTRNSLGQIRLSQRSQEILVREIRNIDPQQLRNADYRNRILSNLQSVIQEIQSLLGARQVGGVTVFGPQGSGEAKYQEHLISCTKEAIKRVYSDEKLVACIGGRDAIEGFYPDTTIPIAGMAQLIEIEKFSDSKSVKCPEKFNDRLAKYNTRHNIIKALSEKLKTLTPEEKEQLVLHILKGSDYVAPKSKLEHQAEIDALVTGIGKIGGDIHQGNLMGVLKLQFGADPVQAQNMFAKAWQEAVMELLRPSSSSAGTTPPTQ